MYMASRFLIGLGITIASSSAPMLAAELAHPESRTTLTSMYNTLWYLGVSPTSPRSITDQLTVLVHHRSMDDIRYLPHQLRMVMETTYSSPSPSRHHQPRRSLVSPRKSSVACRPGSP